jgi:glycosyltransferase involved in cell wall biosynthesis
VSESSLALFLPAHNEAENLPTVVAKAMAFLSARDAPFHVIVVDDGSTDRTAQITAELAGTYPGRVLGVRHPANQGYGAALKTGFTAGLATGHDWVGFCDADNQFDPANVGKLIDRANMCGAEVAIGYRVQRADGRPRRIMGRVWHILSEHLLGFSALDVDCGFKLIGRSALEELAPQLIGEHATVSPELLARASKAGRRMVEVGVDHYPRSLGNQSGARPRVVYQSVRALVRVRKDLRTTAAAIPLPVTTTGNVL